MSQSLHVLSPQKTLRNPIGCVGVGLHTGLKVAMTLNPAPANSGIRFRRHDLAGAEAVPASWDRVSDTTMCTTLKTDPGAGKIATIGYSAASGLLYFVLLIVMREVGKADLATIKTVLSRRRS